MDTEVFFTGYCRCLDSSRMVEVVYDGTWEADCEFPHCPYASVCQIAKEMEALTEQP